MPDARLPGAGRFAWAARLLPAADGAGSCWYDCEATDDAVAVVVGQLGGAAGVGPAQQARRTLLARLVETRSPWAVLEGAAGVAGRQLVEGGGTVLCAVLDLGGAVRWAAIGPARPLVIEPDCAARPLAGGQVSTSGPAAGTEEPAGAGTTLVLCSAGSIVGERLATASRHDLGPKPLARSLAAQLRADATVRASGAALIVVRLVPPPLAGRLPADPRSVPAVRRALTAWGERAGLAEDSVADLELTVSEAVTNAVEHAYRDSRPGEFDYSVWWAGDGGVWVEVRDYGRWRPPPADRGYRGRGLAVISTLTTDVVLEPTSTGTRIAFTMPGQAPPPDGADPVDSAMAPDEVQP